MSDTEQLRRLERLERENAALRAANARLLRERLGAANTAAAGRLVGSSKRRPTVRSALARGRLALRRALLRLLR